MEDRISQEAQLVRRNRRKRAWQRVVGVLACMVVFCTTYALILPAITMEHSCGLEEHIHTEDCYAQPTLPETETGEAELVCQLPEHTHNADCEQVRETEAAAAAVETEAHTETTVPTESTETVPEETGEADIVMEGSGEEGTLFVYTPTEEIGRGTYEGRKLKCGQDGVDGHTHTTDCYEPSTLTWVVTKNTITGEHTLTIHGKGEMPDGQTPWTSILPNNKDRHIIIGPNTDAEEEEDRDEITYIGQNAFGHNYIQSVSISNTVRTIGIRSFWYAHFFGDGINIPGTVTLIEESAFCYADLDELTLNEGTKIIGSSAFEGYRGSTIYLPSTVSQVGNAFNYASALKEIKVSEDNPWLTTVDGVLFRLEDDNTYSLVLYPVAKPDWTYTVPRDIHGIRVKRITTAFTLTQNLKELTIPETVDGMSITVLDRSSVEKVILECDQLDAPYGLCKSKYMTEIEMTQLERIPGNFMASSGVQRISLPKELTAIEGGAFNGCTALQDVYYNAQSASVFTGANNPIFGADAKPRFALTVGPDVDKLQSSFYVFAERVDSIVFEGPNQITIAKGAMAGAPEPFCDLSGDIYIDENGAVYTYDDNSATLIFCPPGVEELNVPATLPEMAGSCPVTAVGKDALKYAEKLESITFADPAGIKKLDTLAMANCMTLISVNGYDNETEAAASFTNPDIQMGYNVFYNTGLKGAKNSGTFAADMNGGQSLTVTAEGAADLPITAACESGMTWEDRGDGTGGYQLLTGENVTITCSTGTTIDNQTARYRVYFRFTSAEGYSSVDPDAPEPWATINGWRMDYHATEDPYTVYAEFGAPPEGSSIGLPINVYYPHYTRGGGLTVWSVIVDGTATEGSIIQSESVMQFSWSTKANEYDVTKKAASETALGVSTDSEGVSYPSEDVKWTITVSRTEDEVSDFGKDLVRSVEFRDVMTLPDGISWKEGIKEALVNNDIHYSGGYFYAGDTKVGSIYSTGTNLSTQNAKASWDEDLKTVVFSWRTRNTSEEEDLNPFTVTLTIPKSALVVDAGNTFSVNGTGTFENTVSAKIHYTYAEDTERESSATRNISGGAANIGLSKTSTGAYRFGEDLTYTLKVANSGALTWGGTEETVYSLSDTLNVNTYIKPGNMEKMFAENKGTIITKAVLGAWESVTGTNGGEAWKDVSNSDYGTAGNKLTISYDSDTGKYLITVNDGVPQAYDHVADGLKDVGYAVTKDATYACRIPVNEEGTTFAIGGGQSLSYKVYATVKNSFQMLSDDWANEYGGGALWLRNHVSLVTDDENSVASTYRDNNNIYKDATLTKSVTKADGTALPDSYACNDGDVLDYQLTFAHYGKGSYENLPLVDDLYGSQYLLVSQADNTHLAERSLETHGDCYILKVGSYEDVVVGVDDEGKKLIADTVTVTAAGENATNDQGQSYTGLHTRIKWYFDSLPSGNYAMWVKYQALVDLDLTGVSYTIGNVAWMNDRPGSRIYASLWGGGTLIKYEKDIVDQKGTAPAEDVLDEDGYSMVRPGQSVTYRLTLSNPNEYTFTLNGAKLADMLPDTFGQFAWGKDVNINGFDIKTEGDVTLKDMDLWELGTEYGGLLDQRQFILWPDTASVTLPKDGKVCIYFTLTYPEDGGEDTTWDKYAEAVNGNPIDNRLYVYRYPSTVKHDLWESGRALLQKGVFGTYYYALDSTSAFHPGYSREYYNIADAKNRAVMYYVVILNDANKRLYLSDVYDALPKGFAYLRMTNGSDLGNVPESQKNTLLTVGGDSSILTEISGDVTYRSATVTATELETGVKFSFSDGSGEYALRWDAERRQHYLERNEAIVIGYLCCTNDAKEGTEAVNTAAMAYTDPLGTGMELAGEEKTVAAVQTDQFKVNNDGSRYTLTAEKAANAFGMETAETWLASDVTLHRGGIMPGIQKSVVSYTPPSSPGTDPKPVAYENHAPHDATVNWKLVLRNAGTQSMTDYAVTDIMPKPYSLVGKVSCVIYDAWGEKVTEYDLLEFPRHKPADGMTLGISEPGSSNNSGKNVTINGDPVAMGSDTTRFHVSVSLDTNGNEVLTLWMEGRFLSIPEGGSMEIFLSSVNPTTDYVYSVFTNQATLVPTQEFTNLAGIGSPMRTEQGLIIGARSSAPVTVTSAFATGSVNEVFFGTDKGSSATPEDTYVVLEGAESGFSYTLTVKNDTTRAMTKLVLIDNLPEVGDHSPFGTNAPRDSEFKVHLADTPGFVVTVVPKEGESYTPEKYTIQYSKSTDFGGPQSSQWMGEEGSQWTTDPTDARAIRVIISETIPADATVTVTFKVKADENAKPGQTAWNNFGYHYALEGENVELEAMPLAVGAKIPSVPELAKKLVDRNGAPLNAAKDTDFTFQVTGPNGSKTFSVTVESGKDISDWLPLDWNWETGKTYTIKETGISKPYDFDRFLGVGTEQYTFTYDPAVTQRIVCQNVMDHWSLQLTKVDGRDTDTVLEGAEFKLYGLEVNTAETKEYEGQTWYLCRTGITDDKGLLEWTELDQEKYLLVETKAPAGYPLPSEPYGVVTRSDTGELKLEVKNYATYELPETGGMGREWIFLAGTWLTALAALGLLLRRRKISG